MAYEFVRASTQSFLGTVSFLGTPLTMAMWFRRTGASEQRMLSLNLSTDERYHIIRSSSSSVGITTKSDAFGGVSSTVTTSVNDTWSQATGQFISASNRRAWVDGTQGSAQTATRDLLNFDQLSIGRLGAVGFAEPMQGRIAEVAVWSVSLTQGEIESLAKGFKASRIRPQSLVYYVPLIRNVQELRSGLTLTASASAPTVANHTRVY